MKAREDNDVMRPARRSGGGILGLALALFLAPGAAAADGGGLTCRDLEAAASRTCLAKYQCASIATGMSLWRERLCQCLDGTGPADEAAIVLDDPGFNDLGFACCAGNAITHDPALCARFPAAPEASTPG
jgi:hypothetical protein